MDVRPNPISRTVFGKIAQHLIHLKFKETCVISATQVGKLPPNRGETGQVRLQIQPEAASQYQSTPSLISRPWIAGSSFFSSWILAMILPVLESSLWIWEKSEPTDQRKFPSIAKPCVRLTGA